MNNLREYKIDKIIFETSYPVLFTCTNEQDELFLVVCCQNNETGRKWLLTKTTEDIVIELLSNKISIRTAFEQPSEKKISISESGQKYSVKEHNNDWDDCKSDIPTGAVFLDPDEGEYDEEISYYKLRKAKGIYKKVYTQFLVSSLSEFDYYTKIEDVVLDSSSVAIASKVIEEVGEIEISEVEMLGQFQKNDDSGTRQRYTATSILSSQAKEFQRIEVICHEDNTPSLSAA